MCSDLLYNLRYIISYLIRNKRNVAKTCTYIFTYSTHYLYQIKKKMNFLGGFSKNSQIQNFMKILPVGAELDHVDGCTGGQT